MSCDRLVYFIRPVGLDGPVKIGISAQPTARLQRFSTWSPVPLEIAATIAGDDEMERRFHARFLHLHTHGEWFRSAPELTEAVVAIRAGVFDVNSLPNPHHVPVDRQKRSAEKQETCTARQQLSRRSFGSGVAIPADVSAAAAQLHILTGPERVHALALIRTHTASLPRQSRRPAQHIAHSLVHGAGMRLAGRGVIRTNRQNLRGTH